MKERQTSDDLLRRAQRRLAAWRARHGGRGRTIPAELWAEAATLARAGGVEQTARKLRLDRRRLARLVEAEPAPPKRPAFAEARARVEFVELDAEVVCARAQMVVQLEGRDGERVRVEMSGASATDVLAVARAFWSRTRCCS